MTSIQKTVRSIEGKISTMETFSNKTSNNAVTHWLDYNGKPVKNKKKQIFY